MAAKAGKVLEDFKRRFPKQHKSTGMLYVNKYTPRKIGRIEFHAILISDLGEFQLKHVTVNHSTKTKTPVQWSNWLNKHGNKIMVAVVERMNTETSQLWKVRSILGWSDAARRTRSKVSKTRRHKTKKKRR